MVCRISGELGFRKEPSLNYLVLRGSAHCVHHEVLCGTSTTIPPLLTPRPLCFPAVPPPTSARRDVPFNSWVPRLFSKTNSFLHVQGWWSPGLLLTEAAKEGGMEKVESASNLGGGAQIMGRPLDIGSLCKRTVSVADVTKVAY